MFNQRQRSGWVGRLAIIGGLGIAVLLGAAGQEIAAQDLTWKPGFEVVTLAPGDRLSLAVAFHATRHFGDGVVRVAPELQPFVQVQPARVSGIGQDESARLTVTIAVPADTPSGQIKGTIRLFNEMQLAFKGDFFTVFADPLPFADPFLLTVNVVPNPG